MQKITVTVGDFAKILESDIRENPTPSRKGRIGTMEEFRALVHEKTTKSKHGRVGSGS